LWWQVTDLKKTQTNMICSFFQVAGFNFEFLPLWIVVVVVAVDV